MSKKLIALLLSLSMLAALTACGNSAQENEMENQEPVEDVMSETGLPQEPETDQPEEAPEEEAGEPTLETDETPAEEAEKPETPAPVEKPEQSEPPAKAPSSTSTSKPSSSGNTTSKPSTPSTPAPEANTPSQKPAPEELPEEKPETKPEAAPTSVDLNGFYETVAGQLPALGAMDGETLDAFYPGLSSVSTKQSGVYMAMMSAAVGELALVEVQNAADVETVKGIFQARIDYQVGDETNPGGAWYPESIEGWKNNSRIVSNGNYVMMVAGDSCDSIVSAFNALFA